MREVHIFLRADKAKGAKRWSYRSMGRTSPAKRAKAAQYCALRNRQEGRT